MAPLEETFAQSIRSIPLASGAITLDGESNEQAWQDVDPLPVVSFLPVFGEQPSERTEILLLHDEQFLYVAGRLYDSDPEGVRANSRVRDSDDASSDWFGFMIDSFNDKETAVAFYTTPAGLRWDAAVSNDAQVLSPWGRHPLNDSWNSFWDVATVRNDKGWFAEFRIPFSSLRFQEVNGRVVVGIISQRRIARKEEHVIFPAIRPDWGFLSCFKPSQAEEFVLEGISSPSAWYVAPYMLGGTKRIADFDDNASVYEPSRSVERNVGLDVKTGLTNNLTLDVTVNTDFAQIEADDEQVNLTRFSLFYPEKRLFFQERSSSFDFTFVGPNRLFHSRRIGIHDKKPVRILGGTRLVGRVKAWDIGALGMVTGASTDVSALYLGVFRARRNIFNPYSYAGGISTVRIGEDGNHNIVYGLDASIRLFGNDYFTAKWAQSFDSELSSNFEFVEATRVHLNLERRTSRGLAYFVGASHVGSEFNPGLGFENRLGYGGPRMSLSYGWFPGNGSALQRHNLSVNGYLFWRYGDRVLESAKVEPGWEFELKNGLEGNISGILRRERVLEPFELSEEAEIPVGVYSFYSAAGLIRTPGGGRVGLETEFEVGSYYDGRRISLGSTGRWNFSAAVQASLTYELYNVEFPNRDQRFRAHIGRIRCRFMPSTKTSATFYVQYNSADNDLTSNVRLRYNPREGIDIYLVYDESLNTTRELGIVRPPLSRSRVLMFKYAHTLVL